MINNKIQTVIEIKTYTNNPINGKIFIKSGSSLRLNPNSNEYYQIQTIIEILNVPYGILVYEYDLK